MHDRYPAISRGNSPAPPSPGGHGLTPSPLRDAMDDVMSSLHDMASANNQSYDDQVRTPSPVDPWSPEAFEEFRNNAKNIQTGRAQSSLGIMSSSIQDQHNDLGQEIQHSELYSGDGGRTQVESYHKRMEHRLRMMQNEPDYINGFDNRDQGMGPPPIPPPKSSQYQPRPFSSSGNREPAPEKKLHSRKSAYELGRDMVDRTFTTRSTISSGTQSIATNTSSSTQITNPSVMSGHSAGAFSATSAGSFARRKNGWGSFRRLQRPSAIGSHKSESVDMNGGSNTRPQTPLTGLSYHSSHDSQRPASAIPPDWTASVVGSGDPLGGLTQTQQTAKPKKGGFLRKLMESAKTGAASTRSSIAGGREVSRSPVKSLLPNGVTGISSGNAAQDMGLGGGTSTNGTGGSAMDWVNVRRDVNRSNSLSRIERQERAERCQLMDQPVVDSVDLLEEAEGDEGSDGNPVQEPTNFQAVNLQLVDKSARFVTSLPPMTNAISLTQGYVCRPYRSDVQRLRAIFTWASEKIAWEEDFEGDIDSRRVIQTRRGCSEEIAVLTMEMCQAVGLHCEVVRGFLKQPGELPELDSDPRPNHWWNAVVVDDEWRIMDCSLASPTNPKRSLYSSAPSAAAETFYFLTRPMEACYTHIPCIPSQQHIVPYVDSSILLSLPCVMPPYFRNNLHMLKYSTSLLYLDGLEMLHLSIAVPTDIELVAEVKARSYARDMDGDLFESGEQVTKRALAQPGWKDGVKRYTIKAVLPGDEGHGALCIYAGKRGLMHSIKDNPYPLAASLPIFHSGANPPYDFLTRHPTPHAMRHDLYLAQPQCRRLACNNTFVFSVRQHPSSLASQSSGSSPTLPSSPGFVSPVPFARPTSALSMTSSQASSSNAGSTGSGQVNGGGQQAQKPAKLAVQAPSGKILRLSRKVEGGLVEEGGTWETVIKVGEKGTWRGLVLADRSARWCVWGEWECV